jgi:hypothetical protein
MLLKQAIKEGRLKVGMMVRTNGDDNDICEYFKGEISFFGPWKDARKIAITRSDGKTGGGPEGSWQIRQDNEAAEIEFDEVESPKTLKSITMTTTENILSFFRNMTASADEKLLKEMGIEDPIGTPTETGLRLCAEILYKENRAKVIEIVKSMKEEQDAAKK